MKALSIRQPWAWAILNAQKRIENRSRDFTGGYRGPVLLHASQSVGDREEFDSATEAILDIVNPTPGPERIAFVRGFAEMHVGLRGMHHAEGIWRPVESLQRGGIVGRARVVDVVFPGGVSAATEDFRREYADDPWYVGDFGLVLADVEPLPFRPWKGALGLFEVPDSVIELRS